MASGGDLLRRARGARGLTQGDLAERAGTSQEQVSRWESGRRSPTVAQLSRLLTILGFELTLREVEPGAAERESGAPDHVRAALTRRRRIHTDEPPPWSEPKRPG
jgi:transcriptional regulator with XRE-family HTH domain